MPLQEELSVEDAKQLLGLCSAGRLYEIDDWIRAGRSLRVPRAVRRTPLEVAIELGFHSLIELLARHAPDQQSRNKLLQHAVVRRRADLVALAFAHGAQMSSVPFVDVLMTGDRALVSTFLDKGADPLTEYPFAHALYELRAKTGLGMYLDIKRQRPEIAEPLQAQADMALRQFCRDGNLKWVSLLLWAGADPRSLGPTLEHAHDECADDPEMHTTAFHEACTWGHTEIVKRLKPDPGRDDLGRLLDEAAFFAREETLAYLLSLGANPNNKPDGGSRALDACIQHLAWEDTSRLLHNDGRHYQSPAYCLYRSRAAIRLLLQHGAIWNPERARLNDFRQILYKTEPDVTIELVRELGRHKTCDPGLVHELLCKPRMQQHLAGCEHRMAHIGLTLDGRRKVDLPKTFRPTPYVLASYDRNKLYEEVWAEPTQKVAARYGISDVALAKVCRQLQVPKPPRGYWAKKAAGQPVPRRSKLLPLKI